jgi:hypothetical protein
VCAVVTGKDGGEMARDPYEAIRNLCKELEAEGADPDQICDALMTTGLNAGAKLAGPEFVACYLFRMAEIYAAKAEYRAPPPKMTQ